MKRMLLTALLGVLVLSCRGGKEDEAPVPRRNSAESREEMTSPPPSDAGAGNELGKLIGARIVPYLDEEGSSTERAVSVGEIFTIYVFAEYNEAYGISAAEFKLSLPEGIEVLGEVKSDSTTLTTGDYDKDFMMAVKCTPGPKTMLRKYLCRAGDGFEGGVVETKKGDTQKFIGFALCEETRTLVAAEPGRAALKKR